MSESANFPFAPNQIQGSLPTVDHDLASRAAVAAQTEIGNPHGRIPTSHDTQRQLAAIQASELPVGTSKTAEPSAFTAPGASAAYARNDGAFPTITTAEGTENQSEVGTTAAVANHRLRAHRNSNYAPEYETARDAVPRGTLNAEGHDAVSFPHEQLGAAVEEAGATAECSSSLRSMSPPKLPPRTHGHNYALSNTASAGTGGGAGIGSIVTTNTGRSSPGASLGSKVKGAFAQAHVSDNLTFHSLPVLEPNISGWQGYLLASAVPCNAPTSD